MFRTPILTLVVVTLWAILPATARADRLALVIGMGAYEHITPLNNSVNDARGIASTLEATGFDVTTLIDAPLEDVLRALDDFSFRAETANLAVVYFAGHGVEVQGRNFLIPVDADVASNLDVQRASISLRQLEDAVGNARRMGVILLDSCRDNPFGDSIVLEQATDGDAEGGTRSAGRIGLAPTNPDRGTVVLYAAKHGQVALDGTGEHSPFAQALMTKLAEPGLEIGVMLRQVRDMVLEDTRNLQEPFYYGSIPGDPFYIAGPLDGQADVTLAADPRTAWSDLSPDQEALLAAQAASGDTRSLLGLGYIHLNTNDPEFDPAAARDYFERAAASGMAEAQFELARMLEQGIGGPQDLDRALALFRQAADQGHPDALNEMGFISFQGLFDLDPDRAAGIDFFIRAAEARDPEAQYNLAALIDDGLVPGKGPQDAARFLYQALRSGNEQVLSVAPLMGEQFELETRRALQEELRANNFYDGTIDGDIGPGTTEAMRRAMGIEDA